MSIARYRAEWFGNIPRDLVSGLLVALALIPEAISFAVIAGVDPKVALYASFSIATIIAFAGGRPGMISAATAAMAVLFVDLVRDHGIEYLFATTIAAGLFQILFGIVGLDRLMVFVSRSVMTGFVNALAILIFMAQLPELTGVPGLTYVLVGVGLAIIYLLPRISTAIPSPLVSIAVITAAAIAFDFDVRRVGDMGALPSTLPTFLIPDIPLTLESVRIIVPTALALAVVGLIESLLTASLLDELTDTPSSKRRESIGQGIANVATGFLGGMGGCAMIGQSGINIRAGGRGRLSTFMAGVLLLFLIVVLGGFVRQIPMAALVAVMIMVSVGTFRWESFRELKTHPASSSIVMVATVAVVVATHNLALGVLTGVLLSGIFFAWEVSQQTHVHLVRDDEHVRAYTVTGQLFFASTSAFREAFDYATVPPVVRIDLTGAHLWDTSAVGALDAVVLKFRRLGAEVEVVGSNAATAGLIARLGRPHSPSEDGMALADH
ncbi:MAG: SulP family inorganic anion transporter [Thermomicrobiales bacterium]